MQRHTVPESLDIRNLDRFLLRLLLLLLLRDIIIRLRSRLFRVLRSLRLDSQLWQNLRQDGLRLLHEAIDLLGSHARGGFEVVAHHGRDLVRGCGSGEVDFLERSSEGVDVGVDAELGEEVGEIGGEAETLGLRVEFGGDVFGGGLGDEVDGLLGADRGAGLEVEGEEFEDVVFGEWFEVFNVAVDWPNYVSMDVRVVVRL